MGTHYLYSQLEKKLYKVLFLTRCFVLFLDYYSNGKFLCNVFSIYKSSPQLLSQERIF